MNDENFLAKYGSIEAAAEEIKKCAQVMDEIFRSVSSNMDKMTSEDNFRGNASDKVEEGFNNWKPKFDEYVRVITTFANTYTTAREMTGENETKISNTYDDTAGSINT